MTRAQAALWASIATLCGAGALYFLLTTVPPAGNGGALNVPAVLGFFGASLLALGGIGTMLA
ncbi:MAG: hypothetical protein ACRC1H_14355, partial [Caldilineaceae bacterium]